MSTPVTIETQLAELTGRTTLRRPVYATEDPAQAEQQGGRVLSPHRLRLRRYFAARFYDAPLTSATLLAAHYTGRPTVVTTAPIGHFNLTLTLRGGMSVLAGGQETSASPGTVLITPPIEGVRVVFAEDTVIIGARLSSEVLERRLAVLTGRPVTAVELAPRVGPSAAASTISAALRQALISGDTAAVLPPPLALAVEEALLTTVLLAVPGSHSDELYRPVEPAAGRAVRQAAAIMRDTGPDCPPLPELAARVGVSLRRLQAGFQATFGTTPSSYLRDVRIDAAHRLLRAARPGSTTVAAVATSVGFTHLGRFSADYRRRHGTDPSATLRSKPARSG